MYNGRTILKRAFKVIKVLTSGPHTVTEIAKITGMGKRTIYYYLKTISEVLQVRWVKRPIVGKGTPPKYYWLD